MEPCTSASKSSPDNTQHSVKAPCHCELGVHHIRYVCLHNAVFYLIITFNEVLHKVCKGQSSVGAHSNKLWPYTEIGPKKGVGALLIVATLLMQNFFSRRKPKFCMSRSIECQCSTTWVVTGIHSLTQSLLHEYLAVCWMWWNCITGLLNI